MAAEIRILISSQGTGSGLADAKRDVQELGQTADKAGGGFSSLREVAVGALREVGALAVNALGQAAQAVGGFLKDSVSAAGDFQSGMLEFQAVAGKGVDTAGLEKFHDLFLDLGKELPVSTADVQKAAIELVKGGIDPATIAAGGLEQTIKFAAAAMDGDLAGAAETSAKIVGGWADVTATADEKAALLAHSTDLLTKAANASTVDVHDLALGLYNVQGTAKTMGLSLDETTTTLAALAPRFSNANTAGTSFRNFLVRLQPTTKPAREAMIDLGLATADGASKFFDAQGKFIGVAQASQLLQDKLKDLSPAQRTMALQTIFGNDAMNAAAALADAGADGYNTMAASLANANGVSENAALKQQGFKTALDNAKGSVEALQIIIGEKLLPILTTLLNDYIAPVINAVSDVAVAFFDAGAMSRDFVLAMDRLGQAIGLPTGFIYDLVENVKGFLATLGLLPPDPMVTALQTMGGAAAETVSPIQNLINTLMSISPVFSVIVGVAQQVWPTLKTLISTVLNDIIGYFQANGAAMIAQAMATYQTLRETVVALTGAIAAVIQAWLAQLMVFWNAHGEEILAFVGMVWATINEIIQLALQLIQATIVPMLQAFAGFISAHGAEIQMIFTNIWTIIKNIITGALALIRGILTAALALFKGDFSGAWTAIQTACGQFVLALYNIIKAALDNLRIVVWEPFWNVMKSFFEGILTSMVGWVLQTFQGIVNAITGFTGAVRSAAGGVADAIVGGITSGIANGASAIVNAAKDAAMAALNAAKSALGISSPSKVFAAEIGKPMAQGMAMGLTRNAPMVAGAAAYTAGAAVQGGRSQVYNSSFTYSPTINGGGMDAPLDYGLAASLAGV